MSSDDYFSLDQAQSELKRARQKAAEPQSVRALDKARFVAGVGLVLVTEVGSSNDMSRKDWAS